MAFYKNGDAIDESDVRGMIFPYAGPSAPEGFLLCDGAAVSRTTYAPLYALIGDTYGSGDGSTTFNIPDLQGRFPLGRATSAPTKSLSFSSRSSNTIIVTGISAHALNEIQTGQAVLYAAPSGAISGLAHNTTYYFIRVSDTSFKLATSVANANAGTEITLSSDGAGAQSFTISLTARPLGQSGGEETHAISDLEMPSHTHQMPKTSATGTGDGYTNDDNTTSFSAATSSAGGDTPHNNMPPFVVINFIIKT
jgi:microcystin-dependent protein